MKKLSFIRVAFFFVGLLMISSIDARAKSCVGDDCPLRHQPFDEDVYKRSYEIECVKGYSEERNSGTATREEKQRCQDEQDSILSKEGLPPPPSYDDSAGF